MIEKKYNFVYQTKNLINGKLYIGAHSTDNINDGYIGCGIASQGNANSKGKNSPFIKAVRKYGYENFRMIPLCFFDTKEEAYEEESYLVDEAWINRVDTYNVNLGGKVNKQYKGSLTRDRHGSSKKVRNKITGEIFDSIQTVSELLNINHSTFSNKLKGRCFNDTDFELVEKKKEHSRLKAPNNIKYENIERYDLQGNLVEKYKYLRDLPTTIRTNILRVFNNKDEGRKAVDGSLWKATDVYTKEVIGFTEDVFKYYLYDLKGNFITKFVYVKDLLEYLGYSVNSSWRVLNRMKKGKPSKGYMIYDNKQEA